MFRNETGKDVYRQLKAINIRKTLPAKERKGAHADTLG